MQGPGRRLIWCGDMGPAGRKPQPSCRGRPARSLPQLCPAPQPAGRSDQPNLTTRNLSATALNHGSVHSLSTLMVTSSQHCQLLSDYGPPSLRYTQGTGNSLRPPSKCAELLATIAESRKEIRPRSAGSRSAMERLKGGTIHAQAWFWSAWLKWNLRPGLYPWPV